MSITLSALQKQRRDTAANWTAANPTLLAGELGYESDTGYWKVGDGSTAWTSLGYIPGSKLSAYPIVNADIAAAAEIAVSKLADGAARQLLQTDAAGTGVEWTSNIDVPGTLDVTGAATFDGNVTIQGDLTVNGTTTTIDTEHLIVEDKNIEIGKVTTPSDSTADGGGITLKGDTDKTISWIDSTDAWTFSEHVNIASGKEYRIGGTKVLDATSLGSGVTGSSLTSVGTISSGTWQGSAVGVGFGGTGQTSYVDGELLIGNSTGNTLSKSTLTAGTGISITNGNGSITINSTVSGGLPTTGGTLTGDLLMDNQSDVRFGEATANGSNWVAFQGPASIASNITWTLPDADGSSGQVLKTDGAGVLSWVSPTTASDIISEGNSSAEIIDTGSDGRFVVTTEGSERLRVDSSGRLGLGTSSPAEKLHLSGTSSWVRLDATATGGGNFMLGSSEIGGSRAFSIYDVSGSAYRLSINSSGNVGIGTTSPDATLDVTRSGNGQIAVLQTNLNRGFSFESSSDTQIQIASVQASTNFDLWANTISFSANGSERARIDSSGRLLVGTSSSTDDVRAVFQSNPTDSTLGGAIALSYASASPADGDWLSRIDCTDSSANVAARIIAARDGGTWTSGSSHPGRLVFSTTADGASSPTERMRIQQDGRVYINHPNNTAGLVVNQGAASGFDSYVLGVVIGSYAPNNATARFISCGDTSATRFDVRSNGGIANYSANNVNLSDRNSKKDIAPASGTWDCLKEWEIVNFRYKDQPDDADLSLGVIAQQVAKSCPEVVTVFQEAKEATETEPAKEERIGVKDQQMVWMAIKALQEAQTRIETLEAEVAALKGA